MANDMEKGTAMWPKAQMCSLNNQRNKGTNTLIRIPLLAPPPSILFAQRVLQPFDIKPQLNDIHKVP